MDFVYSTPGLVRLAELSAAGDFLYHGSDNPKIPVFVPRVPVGTAFGTDGDRFALNPLVVTSPSFEVCAIVAMVRAAGGASSLAWQNMEIRPGRMATAFSVATGTSPRALRDCLLQAGSGTTRRPAGSVYVFDKAEFVDEFTTAGEWFSVEPVEPVEVVHLTAADVVALLSEFLLLDSLFPISDAYIRNLSESITWGAGGHVQYDFDGKRLPKIIPVDEDLVGTLDRQRQRIRQFGHGRAWGHVESGVLVPGMLTGRPKD